MDTNETIRMIRVVPPPAPQPIDWEEIPTVEGRHYQPEVDDTEPEYYPPYLTPSEIKERQIAYMTAAILWFILGSIGVILGSLVWKVCLAIAAS